MMKKASKGRDSINLSEIDYVRKVLADLRDGKLTEILVGGIALSGKSERTTFSLSQEVITHLENLSKVSETKIKDLIDHLIKDIAVKNIRGEKNDWGSIEEISNKLTELSKDKKIRKTYVISGGSLSLLNNLSKILKIERNSLMENIVINYVRFREKLISKRYGKYESAFNKLREIFDEAENELEQLKVNLKLSNDDPLFEEIEMAIQYIYQPLSILGPLIDDPQKIIEWEERQKRNRIILTLS